MKCDLCSEGFNKEDILKVIVKSIDSHHYVEKGVCIDCCSRYARALKRFGESEENYKRWGNRCRV